MPHDCVLPHIGTGMWGCPTCGVAWFVTRRGTWEKVRDGEGVWCNPNVADAYEAEQQAEALSLFAVLRKRGLRRQARMLRKREGQGNAIEQGGRDG